jgi:hypothetical protein
MPHSLLLSDSVGDTEYYTEDDKMESDNEYYSAGEEEVARMAVDAHSHTSAFRNSRDNNQPQVAGIPEVTTVCTWSRHKCSF